jgi:deoxyribonuclease-4
MIYGIHISDYDNLIHHIKEAYKLKCQALQIFLGNKTLTTLSEKYKPSDEEIQKIKELLKKYKIDLYCHAILTLNYCNDPDSKRNMWGLTNLIYDMKLLYKLGGKACVIHVGHYKTKKIDLTKNECYVHFINSLKYVIDNTKKINIYIETPATLKNTICNNVEELAELYNQIPILYKKRIKICVDTCHIFVSGMNISTQEGSKIYFEQFDKLIGLKNVKLIHLNDSKGMLDSHLNRHASLGEGYIFKECKKGLMEILKIANKYNIPLILETPCNHFEHNIELIQDLKENNNKNNKENKDNLIGGKKISNKERIISIFKNLQEYYETIAVKNKATPFKIDSYKKVIKQLEKLSNNKNITSINNLKNIPNIGQKSKNKIKIILETNKLPNHEIIKKNVKKIKIVKNLQKVYGIGPEFSKKILLNQDIKNIQDFKKKVKNKKIILTPSQEISLKYYDNLQQRIPYKEITNITTIFKKMLKIHKKILDVQLLNAGSYAMDKKNSGDIDYILLYDKDKYNVSYVKEVMKELLQKYKYYIATLLDASEKNIYLIKMSNKSYVHQMDIAYVEKENKYFYMLYFNSGKDFSKKIRYTASKKGYKLNEKGLFYRNNGLKVNFKPKSEKDIFDFLEIKYVKSKDRN